MELWQQSVVMAPQTLRRSEAAELTYFSGAD